MEFKTQRRIAAQILKCGLHRVWFDPDRLADIKEAITKADIRSLIRNLAIQKKPVKVHSRFRARKRLIQKRKGRRAGKGSRKGKRTARLPGKKIWISRIRVQRRLLKTLKNKKIITPVAYKSLYLKSKGGFFRSKRHIKLYITEHQLAKKK